MPTSFSDIQSFPQSDIVLKLVLAFGVGLLVGLEREFAAKDVGLRTFSLISVFGLLTNLIGLPVAAVGLLATLVLTMFMNTRAILANRSLEITTSAALMVTFCIGGMVANGHVFSPVATAILMTLLLSWKTELSAFAHGLKLYEIRSAVLLGLLTFVIYPLLPNHTIDPWDLFNPKEVWITILILASLSFVNYVLMKVYSTKGLYYSALLGGAVNSSATVAEISVAVKTSTGVLPSALPILLLTTIAMFIRNLVLLGGLEPEAIPIALVPLLGMSSAAAFIIWRAQRMGVQGVTPSLPLQVSSPVSFLRVAKFALVFIALQIGGTLAQRFLGAAGVLTVSVIGGFVSSASTTASAANLAAHGKITATVAGLAAVLASVASALVNLPLVRQITRDATLVRNLAWSTVACILSGLVLMFVVAWLQLQF